MSTTVQFVVCLLLLLLLHTMHTSVDFRILFLLTAIFGAISSVQIGKIENAMLSTSDTNISELISVSAADCLCQALTTSSPVVAVNFFSNNYTCELVSSYQPTYNVRVNPDSTLYLIQPLPPTSPVTNLTWLLNAIGNAPENYTDSINSPGNLYIDDHNRLVTNEWYGDLIQMDRYNLSVINQISLNTTLLAAVSYNNGLYYIGTGGNGYPSSANSLLIYNSTTMNLVTKINGSSNYFGPIRQCQFARNNTIMLVLSQQSMSYSLILLYQINSLTNYTLINSNIRTPDYGAYNIFKVNDTFFYFVLYQSDKPIYTLTSSADGQNWTVGTFNTQGPQPVLISSVAVDSCGRVWAADQYTYIYIYDPTSGALLGTFNKIPNPYYILLLDNYELFVSTSTNRIYRLAPNIQ